MAEQDKEHREKERLKSAAKRQEALQQKMVLDQMRQTVEFRKQWEMEMEKDEELQAQGWASFKDQQNLMKKEIEAKWFNDMLSIRSMIGENLYKEKKAASELDHSIVEKQVQLSNQKYQQELEKKKIKKEQTNKELREFRDVDVIMDSL